MHPVIGAAIVGGVLYLLFGDDDQEKAKKAGEKGKKEGEKSPTNPPSIAELRSQLKKAIKEKKKMAPPAVTATKAESAKVPVSPPKALQPGSKPPGTGKPTRS